MIDLQSTTLYSLVVTVTIVNVRSFDMRLLHGIFGIEHRVVLRLGSLSCAEVLHVRRGNLFDVVGGLNDN